MTIEELLQSEDISKVVSELRNGRLSVEPNTKEHVAQYDPKMHDINAVSYTHLTLPTNSRV